MASFLIKVVCLIGFAAHIIDGLLPTDTRKSTDVRRDAVDGRLPRNVWPSHYSIEVNPNIYLSSPPFPFDGTVNVYFSCLDASNNFTINSKGLTILSYSVSSDPNSPILIPPITAQSMVVNADADFLTFYLNSLMAEGGWYILTITYSGILQPPTARGFYYDTYVDLAGVTRYMAVTQLESIFAREMFPSFDEPDIKATFAVSVVRESNVVSFSNMPLLRTDTRPGNYFVDVYDSSPVMSTYQVCVAVGNFVVVEAEWQNVTSFPVRIIGRPEMEPFLYWAARVAPLIHAWLEEETGIEYELPKMDHIALPSKGGAMENWGLITYGEGALCVSPSVTGAVQLMSVGSIIAHELAHQYYGNLVTTKWWDDIWLNEGFATYYNYFPAQVLGWPAAESQQSDSRRGTLQFLDLDQRNNSDPVVKPISNVWQAPGVFSGSTYPKGGAIVRFLKGVLGEDVLRRGLTRYLTDNAHGSATTDTLWDALTQQAVVDGVTMPDGSALNIKTIMDPWVHQMGYPILHVDSGTVGIATVTSERFLHPNGQTGDDLSAFNYEWNIPVTIGTADTVDWNNVRPSAYYMIGNKSLELTVPDSGWFVLNTNQNFFYRVNYDAPARTAIANQLVSDFSAIPAESRTAIIDDAFALARMGAFNESEAMELTRYLSQETAYGPWHSALKYILYSDRILRSQLWFNLFRSYMLNQVSPVYQRMGLGFPGFPDYEPPITSFLREQIATAACYYADPTCQADAAALYAQYLANPAGNLVNINALPTALCYGISRGNQNDWITAYEEYQDRITSNFNDERYAFLFGMACSTDTNWISIYLNYIIGGQNIATRDQTQAMLYLVQNNVGLTAVWSYLSNSWLTVPSTIGKFTVLRSIASTWYTQDQLDAYDTFAKNHPPADESQNQLFIQTRLLIVQNIEWFNYNAENLNEWLGGGIGGPTVDASANDVFPVSPYELLFPSLTGMDE